MKKISLILAGYLVMSITLAGCGSKAAINTSNEPNVGSDKVQQANSETPSQNTIGSQSANQSNKADTLKLEIVTETYVNKNVKINYPKIINFSDASKQNQINDLIKNDILNDYQKDITNLVKYYFKNNKEAEEALTENVNYDIKFISPQFISILYVKNGSIPGSAHPNNSIHSMNINIEDGTILKFKDLMKIDDNFVLKLKNVNDRIWTPKALPDIGATDELNKELVGMISDELSNRGNKDLTDLFNSDDYSFYFTKDYFGMSIDVIHAAGDYAELEIKYNDIMDNIKPENKAWKDFIK